MTNEQTFLIKEILLKQKKDIEDILNITFQYEEVNKEENSNESSDEMDLAINSNIINIEDKKLKQNKKRLNEIKIALEKIEQNNYGFCEESGEKINFERLKANPTARYSIEIQNLIEERK